MGLPPTAVAQADTQPVLLRVGEGLHVSNPGSDYMVEVIRSLNIDYLSTMPGSTFRGIHESFINYGKEHEAGAYLGHHEEISAGVAHGYAKVTGKPMAILVRNTVGLQHAAMVVYNAWCDRPASLDSFREATMRAYQIMMTPPFGPAMIMVDGDLAENTMRAKPSASMTYHAPRIAAGDANAVDEIAKLLVGAQNPLILTGRTARTPAAMGLNAARSGA